MASKMTNSSFGFAASAYQGQLAGMAIPGLFQSLEQDMDMLLENNVGAIATLTMEEWVNSTDTKDKFSYAHFPIPNLDAPTLDQTIKFCEWVDRHLTSGINVVCHCFMGVGRTGTMIACYRVHHGEVSETAIWHVRNIRSAIETKEQEDAVSEYYEYLRKHKK